MDNFKNEVKKITSKDDKTAVEVITKMINDADVEMFEELVAQSEYLFPFVKENVCKRFEKSIKGSNYLNLFKFFNCYSSDYDKIFVTALKIFGQDKVKPKMLDLIKNGSPAQKTYAARYYEIAPDLFAIKELIENAFSDDENLADACAAALGAVNEQKSYEIAVQKLNGNDDFEVLKGINFFVSYIKNPPMEDIFNALYKSGIAENIAGKIPYITSLSVLLQNDLPHALSVFDFILTGFGEILPLSEVFNFELYNVFGLLFELPKNELSSQIAVVMLKGLNKIQIICENDQYIFDEDKNTKAELYEVQKLLNSFGEKYWNLQKQIVFQELSQDKTRILSALTVIKDFDIRSAIPAVADMIYEVQDETVICEGLSVLKKFDAISCINKEDVLSFFENETLKALAESYF